jgi:glucose-6-phosphate 1-dehydrogenase
VKISLKFKTKDVPVEKKRSFLDHCQYFAGQYDSQDDFSKFNTHLEKLQSASPSSTAKVNRLFYCAIPPTLFVPTSRCIRAQLMANDGWSRVIVEKPFGRDSESSAELGAELSKLFEEEQIYRIDHYLGKEVLYSVCVSVVVCVLCGYVLH